MSWYNLMLTELRKLKRDTILWTDGLLSSVALVENTRLCRVRKLPPSEAQLR